jgi:hypothetical protein
MIRISNKQKKVYNRKNDSATGRRESKELVRADIVGNTRVPPPILETLVHPDSTPLHQIPQTDQEVVLSKVENLLGKGHYGAALREAKALKISTSPLAGHYEFLQNEKISRAYIGIADRYFIRGDNEGAKKFYSLAINPETTNQTILGIAALADKTFEQLLTQRQGLMDGLVRSVGDDSYTDWCDKRNVIQTETIIDNAGIREAIYSDYHLEGVFGDHPPFSPTPGWVDPLPPETEFIDYDSTTPASVFKADTTEARDVDVSIPPFGNKDKPIRTSVAMAIVSNVLIAKTQIFGIMTSLNFAGQAQGTVPLFHYEYLRHKAKGIIAHIQDIELRMLPIQFKLDDFAELTSTVRNHLLEQEAELEAVNQKINELTKTLTTLAQAEKEMAKVVLLLDDAKSQCDCDWWCWLAAGAFFVLGVAAAIGVALALVALLGPVAGGILGGLLGGIPFQLGWILAIDTVNCDNVGEITNNARVVVTGLRKGIEENKAELNYQLAARDILIANINSLTLELQEINASNQSRLLNSTTLNAIQTQYNSIRQSLLSRAQAVAKLAEDAFNFERDSKVYLIKDAYYDEDKKGYSAIETLLRDLDGLDYIDITGRTQKAMQLGHMISLRKHYPMSFPSIWAAGCARFMTSMKDFDRWFPGTYMQRIKEVRVEIEVEGKPVMARGYISNDGISFVRFSDTGNKTPVDNVDVFAEEDDSIAKLCFKRFQRRRHVDTMAFPDFDSYLHEERMRNLQNRERNFFENVGPESTWLIELLPDQPFDFSRITDVRVYFQYEAFFDDNLKRILQKKRYTGRRQSAVFSIKKLAENEGSATDFSNTVKVNVSRVLFEAPITDKKIVNVGFAIRPKGTTPLNGVSKLKVSFQDATPIQVETNNNGIVATAPDHPAGAGLAELESMTQNKNVDGTWAIRIVELPAGTGVDAIDDVALMINYEFSS